VRADAEAEASAETEIVDRSGAGGRDAKEIAIDAEIDVVEAVRIADLYLGK
jgi:hypothetical protein